MIPSETGFATGVAPGVISDIACARCGATESKSTAAAARLRLRTNPGIEVLPEISFMGFPPFGVFLGRIPWAHHGKRANDCDRACRICPAAFVPKVKLEKAK
jgi:hypothetical protein